MRLGLGEVVSAPVHGAFRLHRAKSELQASRIRVAIEHDEVGEGVIAFDCKVATLTRH